MKLITAIVKPEKLGELIDLVIGDKAHGLTVTEVRGFGRQFGEPKLAGMLPARAGYAACSSGRVLI